MLATTRVSRPSQWWMIPPVILRVGLALLLCDRANRLSGGGPFRFHAEAPDTVHYLQAIENLLARGWYVVYPQEPLTQAGRMPGYGFTYLLFRLVSGPEIAKTLLVCLQVLVSGLSVYYFGLIMLMLTRRRSAFYLSLALYGTALFVADWDYRLMTESLATSSIIFYFYHLLVHREEGRRRHLLFASFWFAYLVFLRPFAAPLILTAVPLLWPAGQPWRAALPRVARDLAIVVSIFAAADAVWVARNHRRFGRVIPLQANAFGGYHYSAADQALFQWLSTVGENPVTEPRNLISWFRPWTGLPIDGFAVPSRILTSRCSREDIERARTFYGIASNAPPGPARDAADGGVVEILDRCRHSFRQEQPFRYHVVAPLRFAKFLFVHAGPTLPLPPFGTLVSRPGLLAIKLFGVASYWVIQLCGAVGLWLAVRRRDPSLWALAFPFLWVSFFFVFVFRRPEARQMTIAYPALCVLAVLCLDAAWTRWRRGRTTEAS